MEKLGEDDLYDLTRGFLSEATTGRDIAQKRRDHDAALDALDPIRRIVGSQLPENIRLAAVELQRAIDEYIGLEY